MEYASICRKLCELFREEINGMNTRKICFILCVNKEQYQNEALYYISRLHVPEGYEIEVCTVWEATCMTAGYNEGMRSSDAKYKIYLHQDVFIVNSNFLYELLHIFSDETIGMIGMVGSPHLPDSGVMWFGERVGKLISNNGYYSERVAFTDIEMEYKEVEAIDGFLMATQYDIPWREDIFKKWDFYDVSQCIEFRKSGYKIVVPRMDEPWVIHDNGMLNLTAYYEERKKYKEVYNFECNIKENEVQ